MGFFEYSFLTPSLYQIQQVCSGEVSTLLVQPALSSPLHPWPRSPWSAWVCLVSLQGGRPGHGMSPPFPRGLEVISASKDLEASSLSPLMGFDWDKQGQCFAVARDNWPPMAASSEERVKATHVFTFVWVMSHQGC